MKIRAIKLIKITMGIMIAGFLFLVYGLASGIGNEFMIRGAIYSTAYGIIISSFVYLYMKASKKTDTIIEITRDSISTTCESTNNI